MRFTGTLLALLAALGGAASAQTTAQHAATVSIPTVLKLKLDSNNDSVSLTQAIAGNACGYPAPMGTMVGLRTWTGTASFANVTIR